MEEQNSIWRLLITPASHGAWNMSVDEAILESVGAGDAPPTLRLYAWQPACLSLGYGQRVRDADLDGLSSHGWDIVRRPTGGRAILHVDELTYAVIAHSEHPLVRGDILTSYERISKGLLAALERLAVPAVGESHYDRPAEGASPGPVCFEVPANWEITVDVKKLVGSAQVRRKNGVLQHGTLPLHGDLGRITRALAFPDSSARVEAQDRLNARATTVERALGRRVDWDLAVQAFAQGFSTALGLNLSRGPLTDEERLRAEALCAEKYGNEAWTMRR